MVNEMRKYIDIVESAGRSDLGLYPIGKHYPEFKMHGVKNADYDFKVELTDDSVMIRIYNGDKNLHDFRLSRSIIARSVKEYMGTMRDIDCYDGSDDCEAYRKLDRNKERKHDEGTDKMLKMMDTSNFTIPYDAAKRIYSWITTEFMSQTNMYHHA